MSPVSFLSLGHLRAGVVEATSPLFLSRNSSTQRVPRQMNTPKLLGTNSGIAFTRLFLASAPAILDLEANHP